MNTHMRELAQRRHALVATADQQRELAAQAAADIRAGLGVADRALAVVQHLKHKPIALGLVAAALTLLVVKPRQAVKWLGYGLTGYTMFQRVRRLLRGSSHSNS